jgi:hypothetical protein
MDDLRNPWVLLMLAGMAILAVILFNVRFTVGA